MNSTIIAPIISGVFAIISAVIAWRLKIFVTENAREFNLKKEKYDELKELYTESFSLFENLIRLVMDFNKNTLTQECSKINAKIHLLAPKNIIEQYVQSSLLLESWSSLYAKASPKKIGDRTYLLQAPDPTKKFKGPAKQEYDHLQEELEKLFKLMRADLQKRT